MGSGKSDGEVVRLEKYFAHPIGSHGSGAVSSVATLQSVRETQNKPPMPLTGQTEATAVTTLQNQFSGYGSTSQVVARCLDRLALKEPLEAWSDGTIEKVVEAFVDEKFPTVIALNKIDHVDADKVFACVFQCVWLY